MALIDELAAALAAAAGTYGKDVANRVAGVASDATVGLGLKLLGRIRRGKKHPAVEAAVTDVAEHPGDEDFAAALRAQLKKAIGDDAELAADLEKLVRSGGLTVSSTATATATGERSAAVAENSGIVSTGDQAVNRIVR